MQSSKMIDPTPIIVEASMLEESQSQLKLKIMSDNVLTKASFENKLNAHLLSSKEDLPTNN